MLSPLLATALWEVEQSNEGLKQHVFRSVGCLDLLDQYIFIFLHFQNTVIIYVPVIAYRYKRSVDFTVHACCEKGLSYLNT